MQSFCAAPNLPLFLHVCLKSITCYSPVRFLPPWSAKVFCRHQLFNILKRKSISCYCMLLWAFCQQFSQIEARNRGNRDPTSATPAATLNPEKTQGFASPTVTFLYYWMVMWLTSWWCECGIMTIVENSVVFKLNFDRSHKEPHVQGSHIYIYIHINVYIYICIYYMCVKMIFECLRNLTDSP